MDKCGLQQNVAVQIAPLQGSSQPVPLPTFSISLNHETCSILLLFCVSQSLLDYMVFFEPSGFFSLSKDLCNSANVRVPLSQATHFLCECCHFDHIEIVTHL